MIEMFHDFPAFLVSTLLLNISPGNDTIFIISRSIAQGRRAGIVSALGIGTGVVVHTCVAAFGLSLLLAESAIVFNIVRLLGAGYLLYLGVSMWRSANPDFSEGSPIEGEKLGVIYRQGVMTNVLNPKIALFFIAFLPQFIDPAYRASILPFLMLGGLFTLSGTTWCLLVALFASAVSGKLKRNPSASRFINKACAIVLCLLGVKLAWID